MEEIGDWFPDLELLMDNFDFDLKYLKKSSPPELEPFMEDFRQCNL